ncbi:MAG: metallophosphoesterase family protein [Candidatus Acidiferrum sp.]
MLGLISDTHGLLREEAVCALRGADLILHAGDVGSPEILEALTEIAPLFAVRGNVDTGVWAKELPMSAVIEAGSVTIYMLHILKDLEPNSVKTRIQIVVSGHSHAPGQMEKNGVTYINPGSAGPRRFRLPVTLARLDLGIKPWKAQFIELEKKFGSQ